jgi:murein DD-endopeptidase MepM/ murein hydrolase activator NlpD
MGPRNSAKDRILLVMSPRALKTWIFAPAAFGFLMAALTALGLAPVSEAESRILDSPVRTDIAVPSLGPQLQALAAHGLELSREDEVRAGDSFGRLLARMGIEDHQAEKALQNRAYAKVLRTAQGRTAVVQTDLNNRLLRLQLLQGGDAWIFERVGDGQFEARNAQLLVETRTEHRSVEVGQSFFGAMDQANVPSAVTDEIVTLFESDLDFRRQVKAGDKVRVIYQTKQVDGRDLGDFRLIAVRFEASGQTYEALYYESSAAPRGNFYDAEGKSVKRGFLAAPLRFTRISSSFSRYRLHPLFGDPRAHQGVDYAAPVGTPVRAVADGEITAVGRNGGYGNAVGIQHNQRYSTYYAHLSRFAPGIKHGRSVRMGEVIGYVGSTGWATGPHLHYEFRVHGRSIDPTKIAKENPQVPSLSGPDLIQFTSVATDLRKRLSLLDSVNTAAGPNLPPAKSSKSARP